MELTISARVPLHEFWRGRRVFLTGHTGFKGSWLAQWLAQMGATVTGLSLAPQSQPNLFQAANIDTLLDSRLVDIRDTRALTFAVQDAAPEVVFHLAAQALVRPSYLDPLETLSTNIMGTAHVLEALRHCPSARAVVCVTTDKVYHNREWVHPYREGDPLGGHDPYSASKAASELVVDCFRKAYLDEQRIAVATARAGNVIGGGDWSQDRLLPDAMRAWSSGRPLEVRRPDATRPWQHVLEPLNAYLVLAESLWANASLSGPWNFGPDSDGNAPVRQVVNKAQQAFGQGITEYAQEISGPHEASLLALDNSKARTLLGLRARWTLDTSIHRTIAWYREHQNGKNARDLCMADIEAYLT